MKNNKLEGVLKEWAARRAPKGPALDELSARIERARLSERYQNTDSPEEWATARHPWGRLAYLAAGLAAGLAMAFMLRQPRGEELAGAVRLAKLSADQVEARRAVFGEMETLFSGQLRWCSVSGEDVQMGVSEVRTENASSPAALVRLVVVHRARGESEGRRVWTSDIVAREQEFVELSPNPESDNRVTLWLYGNQDGTFVVESTLALHLPVGLSSQTEAIMRPGIPVELGYVQTEDGDYRIYQAVQALPQNQRPT